MSIRLIDSIQFKKAFWRMPLSILVHFSGQEDQVLTFDPDPETDILLDYDQICKKILQTYKFIASGKHHIRLTLLNFYGKQQKVSIPIFVPKNWTTMIVDMLERDLEEIEVEVVQQGQLRLKKQRVKEMQVQFDSDGSVESAEDNKIKEAIQLNRPTNEAYKGDNIVRCHFCNLTNRETQGRRESGPLYGPFKDKTYGHLLCLLWCSCIHLDQKGRLCRVEEGIKSSKNMTCMYCKQKGASFTCHAKSCRKESHYRCANIHHWYFNWSNFTVFCFQDAESMPMMENTQTGHSTQTIPPRQSAKMQIEYRQQIEIEHPSEHQSMKREL